jgi:arsenate reductase
MSVTIYHNPKCSKSRQTLELLREHSITPVIIEYLKSPPSAKKLKEILAQLGYSPRDLDLPQLVVPLFKLVFPPSRAL